MTLWKHYHLAKTIPEALEQLSRAPGPARIVAGGTDLLLDMQQGRHGPVHTLVDVTGIPELVALEVRSGQLFVGAGLPLNRVISSPLVKEHAQALWEACSLIGGPQVRNTATLGGNVGHALPAGDGTIALLALGAQAEVASPTGLRLVPLETLFLGPGQSALDPGQELLVGFYLPLVSGGQASAFQRVMRPQGVAIAILNMGVWLQASRGQIQTIRIAVGPAGLVPCRARQAEAVLTGQVVTPELLGEAADRMTSELSFRTSSHRATSQYRHHLAGVLLEKTIRIAFERVGAERES